jgi:hypothetical protein
MFNYASYCKRFSFIVIFILLIFSNGSNYFASATSEDDLKSELNENIESILDKNDFSSLDSDVSVVLDINLSFKDFVKSVLNSEEGFEYNSLLDNIKTMFFA